MNAAQLIAFETQHQALDEALYPLAVTVGEVELAAAGSIGPQEIAELAEGGHVQDFGFEFSVLKTVWEEAELAPPAVGLRVVAAGITFRVAAVSGHGDLDPDWSLKARRSA